MPNPLSIRAFVFTLWLIAFCRTGVAACGATTYVWTAQGGTTAWTNNANWSPNTGRPDNNTENARIEASAQIPVWPNASYNLACFELASGSLSINPSGNRTLTIEGDYFKNPYPGSLTTAGNFTIDMNGTVDQIFQSSDAINRLQFSSATTIRLPDAFAVTTALTIGAGAGTIQVEKGLTLLQTTAVTIPASATVEVMDGAVLTAMGGLTVAGTLKINAGGKVVIANGRTLSVSAGGILRLTGAPGNLATIDADQGNSTYTLNVIGAIDATYFSIGRTVAAGVNVTGQVIALSEGEFHYPATGGYAVTLATATTVSNLSALGFFDEHGYGNTRNFNATGYTGTAFTVSSWQGLGDTAFETDPSNRVGWGTAGAVLLKVTNRTAAGSPPATIAQSSAATLFATLGFALTGTGTPSDLTSLKLTLAGANVASDVAYGQLFNDTNGNCVYDAGTDLQIASNFTFAGSPPVATVTIPAATVSVSNTTQKCVHVRLATSAAAQVNDTLRIKVASASDVVNSLAYAFDNSGSPPVQANLSTITGTAVKRWNGGSGTAGTAQNWNTNANDWTSSGAPATTNDCQIGPAYSYLRTNGNRTCTNVSLTDGGRLDFNSTADTFTILGSLTIGSGYNFSLATSATLALASTAAAQTITAATAFAGNVTINNTSSSGLVLLGSDFTVNGDLTVTAGTLRVPAGLTLTVLGNVNVNGGSLTIDPGGTIVLGDGRTLTVGASGTLSMIGTASQLARLDCSGTVTGCAVVVNGTFSARYYSFNRLAVAGVTVNSGATIDAANPMPNGAFTYPIGTNPILLRLNRQVPGNLLDAMYFDTAGSPATGAQSILTNTTAGTLTVSNYSGDLTNCCTTAPVYVVNWTSPTNTLDLTVPSPPPALVNAGDLAVKAARFAFQQTQAGAFADTDITSMKLTLQGTGIASDVAQVRLYYDSACTGTGGTQVGTAQTFSGSPSTVTFSGLTGATVQFSLSSPPLRCFYVEFDIAGSATAGVTLGVEIASSADVTNSQGYAFNPALPPPTSGGTTQVDGTTIIWDGSSSTAWGLAANWNLNRLPTANDNCVINNAARDPRITVAGAVCKSLLVGNGILLMNTGMNLDLYGSLVNTGTITQTGTATITIRDDGATVTNQTVQSVAAVTRLAFNKTAGGNVYIGNSNLTLNNFAIPAGQNFNFVVANGDTLTLPNGATITSAVFQVEDAGTVKVTNGQTILVNGGTLRTTGINDGHPQLLTNKATFTNNGAGTWDLNATSGTLDLTGFNFSYLGVNGVQVTGTTSVTNLNGGQLTNLSTTYTSVRGFQFNTTGSLPATADYVGWNWGPNNVPPGPSVAYLLASSTGCASQTISFTNWFGDFFLALTFPVPSTKVSAVGCTINIGAAASPVQLVDFKATGHDGGVRVDWTTGLDVLHRGFNVLRALNPEGPYHRINAELIRRPIGGTSVHGTYRFNDLAVTNGITYFYKLEDFAANGQKSLRGPVSTTPFPFLGPLESAGSGVTVATSGETSPNVAAPEKPAPIAAPAPLPSLLAEDDAWGREGVVLTIDKTGWYRVTYADLARAGAVAPVAQANTEKLRLLSRSGEVPLNLVAADGLFSEGDSLEFFVAAPESPQTRKMALLLFADATPGRRITGVPGNVHAEVSPQASYSSRLVLKTPTFGLFGEALGSELEHIYWKKFYAPPAVPGDDRVSTTFSLPALAPVGTVTIKAFVKGSRGTKLQDPTHHVQLYVNSLDQAAGDRKLAGNEPNVLVFEVPAARFHAGPNFLELRATGDFAAGDYDIVNLEKVEIDYPHEWTWSAASADIQSHYPGRRLSLRGIFGSAVRALDITNFQAPTELSGLRTETVAGEQLVSFGTRGGRRFFVTENTRLLSPFRIELHQGNGLLSRDQGADVIYVVADGLMDAVAPLAALRESQGFRVKRVALSSIVREVGKGIESADAIKEFLRFAVTRWALAPRYALLVGDSTYDPKNDLGRGAFPALPLRLGRGQYIDFADDNWFAALGETLVPSLALGRIPGATPELVGAYVAKVLAHERRTAPKPGKWVIVSDTDQLGGEHFEARADELAEAIGKANPQLKSERLSRVKLGDERLRAGILGAFQSGAGIIHYLGHGAEDRWASEAIFTNAEAAALSHPVFPVIIAMNCLNGNFYDANPANQSLADKLLFNPRGGAIAVWASTSLTSPDLQVPFQRTLYERWAKDPSARIGDLLRDTKVLEGGSLGTAEIVGSWTLFGDPMVRLF